MLSFRSNHLLLHLHGLSLLVCHLAEVMLAEEAGGTHMLPSTRPLPVP